MTTLFECPRCGRRGFTRVGLARHYCPGTEVEPRQRDLWAPPSLRRRRLTAAEIALAKPVAEVPVRWGPYRLNDAGWYCLDDNPKEGGAS